MIHVIQSISYASLHSTHQGSAAHEILKIIEAPLNLVIYSFLHSPCILTAGFFNFLVSFSFLIGAIVKVILIETGKICCHLRKIFSPEGKTTSNV